MRCAHGADFSLDPASPCECRAAMHDSSAFQIGQTIGVISVIALGFAALGLCVFSLVAVILACVRRTRGWIIAACITGPLTLALVGVGAVGTYYGIQQASVPKKMKSADGRVSVMVPGYWQELKQLNGMASLQTGSPFREEYLMVITEPKRATRATLDLYTKIVLEQMEGKFSSVTGHGTIETLAIHGVPARRTRLAGTAKNVKIVYLVTTLDDGQNFHQVLAWTLDSKEATAWPVLKNAADSFEYGGPVVKALGGQ